MSLEINSLNTNSVSGSKAKSTSQAAKTDSSHAPADSSAASSQAKATVVISQEAKLLSQISSQVSTEASVDESKVDAIKAAISDGSYTADAGRIADKLVDIDDLF